MPLLPRPLLFIASSVLLAHWLPAAQMDVLDVPGVTLEGNPLGDPVARQMAVYSPDKAAASQRLPMIVYLPGWGGSSEEAIAQDGKFFLAKVVDGLAIENVPLRMAIVDGRSRYGGSQFLNSSATGNYADYVADEIFKLLLARYGGTKEHPATFIVAGHSSGGYGALMLAMSRHDRFHAVVALSPDSDFETTHKPLVQDPALQALTPAEVAAAMAPPGQARMPEGSASLFLGLCANYAPDPAHPGRFDWLYDARGQWRPEVWQRWIDHDPLTAVRAHPDAFLPSQRVYLDGPEQDDYGANIGARKIYEVLQKRPSPVTFYEPPGHHGDNMPERLKRGLAWALER